MIFFEGNDNEYMIFPNLYLSKEFFLDSKMLFVSLEPILILRYSITKKREIEEFNFFQS